MSGLVEGHETRCQCAACEAEANRLIDKGAANATCDCGRVMSPGSACALTHAVHKDGREVERVPYDGRHGGPCGDCDPCKALLDADDRDGLLERSLEQAIAAYGPWVAGIARDSITEAHSAYFRARVRAN